MTSPTSPRSLLARVPGRLALVAAAVLALVATLLPSGTPADAQAGLDRLGEFVDPLEYGIQGEGDARVGNVDRRVGSLAPTAAQRDVVAALGATRATWNAFGTPEVLINHGGYLSGPRAGNAVDVARAFVTANRGLFRLDAGEVADLELLRDSPLYDAPDLTRARDGLTINNPDVAHVVLFRQTFGDLHAGRDGLLNVGVAADGRVAWVSSSVTGDTRLTGARTVSPRAAIERVAADVGFDLGTLVASDTVDAVWQLFDSTVTKDVQRIRAVAVPTPTEGVRQAWEVTLLASEPDMDGHGNPVAYIAFVDAANGRVLYRTNQVEHAADDDGNAILAQAPPSGGQFSGSTGAGGVCGPMHPFTVEGEDQRTITVAVTATAPPDPISDDDITINLYFEGRVVAAQDLLTSPEVLTYSPRAGIAPGEYTIEVCPFNAEATTPAIPYQGLFSVSPVEANPPLPAWRVFPTNPNLTTSAAPSEDVRRLWCWTLTSPDCDRDVQNTAARQPWDVNAQGLVTNTTDGNLASTAISEASFLTPDSAFDRPAPDPTRDYQAPWSNNWFETSCDPTSFAVPAGADIATADNDDDASVYNLFVMHNRMHDWSYYLGFTEGNANLQSTNFGNGGLGGDPELGSAQAGRLTFNGRDNANQITLQDGVPGVTNQYLWQPLAGAFYGTCTDGAYDMAIVAHEYAHAISTRMTAGPDATLGGSQGQSESWSDLAFAEYFRGFGLTAGDDVNAFALAPLVTGDPQAGIRNYGMNDSPLNYSDISYDGNGTTSPHADGEIWSAVNYDISIALNELYDDEFPSDDVELQVACARGEKAADDCPGNRRWAQLMFDGFLLQPASPSMVDSRDAMMAGDMLRFGGANQDALWDAFAHRGLGADAESESASDADPVPSFASPVSDNATVRFVAAGDAGSNARMEVFVGAYEARVTPVANTFDELADLPSGGDEGSGDPLDELDPPAESNEEPPAPIDDTAEFVPGTYEFFATAPGFGGFRFTVDLRADQDVAIAVPLRTNTASISQGAEASGAGVNLPLLIDDTEETNWASLAEDANPDAEEGEQVEGRTVTFDLAGSDAVRLAEVNISAALRPEANDAEELDPGSQSRFSALRSFDLFACNADAGDDCASDGGYEQIFASSDDAFDGQKPRPKAPDFTLRPFDVTDTDATHLRLVVRDNQCTGGEAYQESTNPDNDPLFTPDCDTQATSFDREVLSPPVDQVRAAEVQVFSTPAPTQIFDTDGNPIGGQAGVGDLIRVFGGDRIDTGIELSKRGFPNGADTAVVARADDFPDALAAATLTAEVDGPLLLTGQDGLDRRVADELRRLGVEKVYLAGGTTALAPAVESAAANIADVERLAGGDRFDTAALIAAEVVELGGDVDRTIVARADAFPDALAAANLATSGRSPILLTRTGDLPETTLDALESLVGADGDVIVVGGPVAVSQSVEDQLADGGFAVDRIAGGTRYGTAQLIVERALDEGVDLAPTLLASGEAFPDALTAGPVAHALGGALGLVHPQFLAQSPETLELLRDNSGQLGALIVAGGPVAVADSVLDDLARSLSLTRVR